MPNWANNRITVKGSEEDIAKFVEHIRQRPRLINTDKEWDEQQFTFHSFITPDESVTYEEYHGTNGFVDGKSVGDTKGNWYNWNNNHWDTKWDANSVDLEVTRDIVFIGFDTAWGPPEPVFRAMTEMFPTLTFNIWWEEEQGFGATLYATEGELEVTERWDIPNSHYDYESRGNEDGCRCAWSENESDWYDDCPRTEPFKPFSIVAKVTHSYTITVREKNELDYYQIINNYENGFDNPKYITVVPTYGTGISMSQDDIKEVE